ncbi:MAG TPA: hypothetical protein VGP02_01710 [Mycobacteriales bacterium]|jgi:hypothetical protein|nr:hypothetical protein [Mycobacteriales bacterium]
MTGPGGGRIDDSAGAAAGPEADPTEGQGLQRPGAHPRGFSADGESDDMAPPQEGGVEDAADTDADTEGEHSVQRAARVAEQGPEVEQGPMIRP